MRQDPNNWYSELWYKMHFLVPIWCVAEVWYIYASYPRTIPTSSWASWTVRFLRHEMEKNSERTRPSPKISSLEKRKTSNWSLLTRILWVEKFVAENLYKYLVFASDGRTWFASEWHLLCPQLLNKQFQYLSSNSVIYIWRWNEIVQYFEWYWNMLCCVLKFCTFDS